MKNIFIIGGTGFLGKYLVPALLEDGHSVTALVRSDKYQLPQEVKTVKGDGVIPGAWQEEVKKADITINLAGFNIAQPWTKKVRKKILESRIETTKNVIEALPEDTTKMLINASAIGYYGFSDDRWLKEDASPGDDFLADVCKQWEEQSNKAKLKGVKLFVPRLGVILGNGGALENMLKVFKRFIGGRVGSGKQWFSWMYIKDVVEAVRFVIKEELEGTYNFTSPHPVQNAELTKILAKTLGVPALFPAPAFALKLALGDFSCLLLEGQRVSPEKFEEKGFTFKYPTIQEALNDLLKK